MKFDQAGKKVACVSHIDVDIVSTKCIYEVLVIPRCRSILDQHDLAFAASIGKRSRPVVLTNRVVCLVVGCKLSFVGISRSLIDLVRNRYNIDIAIESVRPVCKYFRLIANPTNHSEPTRNIFGISCFAVSMDHNPSVHRLALADISGHIDFFEEHLGLTIQSDRNNVDADARLAESLRGRFGGSKGLVSVG